MTGVWIFTFGSGQRLYASRYLPTDVHLDFEARPGTYHHPVRVGGTGLDLNGRFVRVHGPSREEARERMVRVFGLTWADQYPDETSAGVEEYGLVELPLGLDQAVAA